MINDHILFRDKKGIFETQTSLYIISLSLADGLVLVAGILFSAITWGILIGDSRDFDSISILFSIIPLLISLVLIIPKPTIAPLYMILLSILTLQKERKIHNKSNKKTRHKSKSSVLGFADSLTRKTISEDDKPWEFEVDDLDESKRIKIILYKINGDKLANCLVQLFIDDTTDTLDNVRTSLDGVLEVDVTPKTYGIKKLVIQNENNEIIRTIHLEFVEKTTF